MAQRYPLAYVSAGRGLVTMYSPRWAPDANTHVGAGYAIAPGFLICGYADFNSFTFQGDEGPSSTGSYSTTAYFLGAKAYATIPGNRASPYFIGAVGTTKAMSGQDTVYTHHHGNLQVYQVSRGSALSFLGAVGSDIRVYNGLFCFAEIGVGASVRSSVFGLTLTARAGVGYNFY
jgi:hypothetical protein